MRPFKTTCSITLMLVALGLFSRTAWAIPSAAFTYTEGNLGGGMWQYDYTLFNTSDPIADAGFDLYDLFFTFDSSAAFTIVPLPTGWDSTSGAGFIDAFSLNPGAPPGGTDIAPETSLGGFSFQFDYQAGALSFEVLFSNPDPNGDPFKYSGTSAPFASPIPEPATILLLSSGLAGLAALRKRFLRKPGN